MHLIPVLDLACGLAVHARGGARQDYRPVESVLIPDHPGSALALARAYRESLGARHCYVADLDAIRGRRPQHELLQALAEKGRGFGDGLLVDAGIADEKRARAIVTLGASFVVVGLETLTSFEDLAAIVAAVGTERVVFSLDLRDGSPTTGRAGETALDIATRAAAAGVQRMLVLDLARVGQGGGVDLELIEDLKRRQPAVSLLAGGGIRGREDLTRLAETGCYGALVATAVHEGRLTAADFEPPAASRTGGS